ncbi:MAG: hypothetical protein O3A06_13735, partial [Proteobacteria bacterium]|nr:hypothetical protein [Pseudomonadota bacterium]
VILAQCGIALESAELVRIRAPDHYRDFLTPVSRELARAVPLPRPELADTVWVTHATRDLGIAIAHELAHVLMDSGAHSDEPGNLMRDETDRGNTRLNPAQCDRMRDTAHTNGLLR